MCTQSHFDSRVANQHPGQPKSTCLGGTHTTHWSHFQNTSQSEKQERVTDGQASRDDSNESNVHYNGPLVTADAEALTQTKEKDTSVLKPGVPRRLVHLHQGGRTSERGGPSKFRGVVWHKSNSKWEARIYEGGKQKFLGYFTNENVAAMAYDDYAIRVHGNIQKLNFPERYTGVPLPPLNSQATKLVNNNSNNNMDHSLKGSQLKEHGNAADTMMQGQNLKGPRKSALRVQPVKGSSRFRGVSWNSNCSKWRAQVWKGSEVHHLGYFEHEEDAARAYDEAALRIRGPDAPINFSKSEYGVYSENEDDEDGMGTMDRYDSRSSTRSRMLGVSRSKGGWVAEIWDGVQYISLCVYPTEVDAAEAYDRACLERHGVDALTNFPLGKYDAELAAVALRELSTDPEGLEGLSESSEQEEPILAQLQQPSYQSSATVNLLRPKVLKVEPGMPFTKHARFVEAKCEPSAPKDVVQHMASKLYHALLKQQNDSRHEGSRNVLGGQKRLQTPPSFDMERALSSLVNLVQARRAEADIIAKREKLLMTANNQAQYALELNTNGTAVNPMYRADYWNRSGMPGGTSRYYHTEYSHPQMVANEFAKRAVLTSPYDQSASANSALNGNWTMNHARNHAPSSKRARLW